MGKTLVKKKKYKYGVGEPAAAHECSPRHPLVPTASSPLGSRCERETEGERHARAESEREKLMDKNWSLYPV